MPNPLTVVMAFAALLFVALSATINALFLSSLGRTVIEASLLAALSVGADIAKAGLPIIAVRAVALRAWGHLVAALIMLSLVMALSLASGIGFAAVTRNAAGAANDARAERLAVLRRDAIEIDARLQQLRAPRPLAVIEADLDGLRIDRRWMATRACTDVTLQESRTYCGTAMALQSERASAIELARLEVTRTALRDQINALSAGSHETDPQSAAIAVLIGVDGAAPRRVVSVFLALVIEAGSVLLIFLSLGPTLSDWKPPGRPSDVPVQPAKIPMTSDVARWQRRQAVAKD